MENGNEINILLGLTLGKMSKTIDLATGLSKVNTNDFSYESLAQTMLESKLPAITSSTDSFISSQIDSNVQLPLVFCEKNINGFCINQDAISESSLSLDTEELQGTHLSSHICIQHCKIKNFDVSKQNLQKF